MKIIFRLISISFFLYALSPKNCFAQIDASDVAIVKGASIKKEVSTKISTIIGLDKAGNAYAILSEGRYGTTHRLASFDASMKQVNSVEIILNEQDKELFFETVLLINDQLVLFSSFFNKKTDKRVVFTQTVDKKTLLPNKNIKVAGELPYIGVHIAREQYQDMYIKLSKDSSKICLFQHSFYSTDKVWFMVLDGNMNLLWQTEQTLKPNDVNKFMSFDIDNKGNVFASFKQFQKEIYLAEGEAAPFYYMLGIFDQGKTIKKFKLGIKEKEIRRLKVSVTNNNDIICTGFFYKTSTESNWGSCFFKINGLSRTIEIATFKEFDLGLLATKNTVEEREAINDKLKNGKPFSEFSELSTSVSIDDKNDVFLFGESNYAGEFAGSFGGIFVIKYSDSGNIIWSEKILKGQIGNFHSSYSAYSMVLFKNNVYILFNDAINNFNLKEGAEINYNNPSNESMFALVKIDTNGVQTKKALFANEKNIMVKPEVFFTQLNQNKLLVVGGITDFYLHDDYYNLNSFTFK
ncbi:MAG: hypothetical protein H7259_07165 [Cytophagales bacterium]|nr:hypothetical protein [Cytophaga sp.]